MSITTAPRHATTDPAPGRSRRGPRARGVALTIAAAAGTWALSAPFGPDFVITDPTGSSTITLFVATVFTLQVALLGWAVLAVLERFSRYGTRIWTVLAGVVLAASMVPVFLVEATPATRLALVAIHAVVGAVLIRTLPRPGRW